MWHVFHVTMRVCVCVVGVCVGLCGYVWGVSCVGVKRPTILKRSVGVWAIDDIVIGCILNDVGTYLLIYGILCKDGIFGRNVRVQCIKMSIV